MRTLFSYFLALVAMFLLFGGLAVGYGEAVIGGSVLIGCMIIADAIRQQHDSTK